MDRRAGFPLIVMIANTVCAKTGDALSSRALACPERSRMGGISVSALGLRSRSVILSLSKSLP